MVTNSIKKISVSKSVYDRLLSDKEEFTKKNGISFSFNSTIAELYKIIDSYTKI